ncbi:hypothetical protein [Pseudoduganella umbonata]|uniref:Uncharacterized protein n=1 Tax=Pseudoduganella umbonata TaxID=864828 RepID=A0A4P8HJG7_9BURK|nr:hypothetical protein [Pseudoduganella umbonata]MBB3219810.1 hypothetical protein [Pseudoduganella umbonata]QCP09849.1 hypothetical protein FCL38_04985 [Pseudoduganella umbonata]
MKAILLLMLALCLCTSAVAGQRAPHDCCPDQHCSLQCIDMGCAPGALAIAPPPALVNWPAVTASVDRISDAGGALPSPCRTVWVPPD